MGAERVRVAGFGRPEDGPRQTSDALAVAIYLDGSGKPAREADGSWCSTTSSSSWSTPGGQPIDFTIPATRAGTAWQTASDTYDLARPAAAPLHAGGQVAVDPRSIVVLRGPPGRRWPSRVTSREDHARHGGPELTRRIAHEPGTRTFQGAQHNQRR